MFNYGIQRNDTPRQQINSFLKSSHLWPFRPWIPSAHSHTIPINTSFKCSSRFIITLNGLNSVLCRKYAFFYVELTVWIILVSDLSVCWFWNWIFNRLIQTNRITRRNSDKMTEIIDNNNVNGKFSSHFEFVTFVAKGKSVLHWWPYGFSNDH